MKKNDIIRLTIEDMSDEGLGIGHAEGMAIFVKDTVPGDTVDARIVKEKKRYAFARAEKIIEPGEHRVTPRCPVARACGGCQIQEMDYVSQLRLKQQKVRNNLERIGGFRIDGNRITDPARSETASSESQGEPDTESRGALRPENLPGQNPEGGIRGSSCLTGGNTEDSEPGPGNAEAGVIYPIAGMTDPWKYRNKAQFPVGTDRDGNPTAGFYAGRTHTIIDNHRCVIGIDDNQYILEAVLEWMRRFHISAYDEAAGEGLIRHVMTRAGFATGQMMAVIVASSGRIPHEEALVDAILKSSGMPEKDTDYEGNQPRQFTLTGIILNINRDKTNVILGEKNRVLWGRDYIEDRIDSLTYRISPRSFYQVNPLQTKVLYETALEYAGLTGTEKVWDLYCGIGTISLFLARSAGSVTGVEVIPEAVKNAGENARLNHIDNCRFICAKAEDAAGRLGKADVIVTDPPRKGLDRTVTDAIIRSAPERIVYVSCDSATLARDLRILCDGGYVLRKIQPVDMFPHTVHVECVTLLQADAEAK